MKRLINITDEEYMSCNPLNRELVEDFLSNSTELSDRTLTAYKSNLRICNLVLKDNSNNNFFK